MRSFIICIRNLLNRPITRVTKSRKVIFGVSCSTNRETRNSYKILVKQPEG
jgi:hypothetical protein